MKLTFEHYGEVISKEIPSDAADIFEVVDELVLPVLTAAGFSEESVREAFADYSDNVCVDCRCGE